MPRRIHLEPHLTDDELQKRYWRAPAEHLLVSGPLTNMVLVYQHFASIEELEDAQTERCVALQAHRALIRSNTRFHWWPKRI